MAHQLLQYYVVNATIFEVQVVKACFILFWVPNLFDLSLANCKPQRVFGINSKQLKKLALFQN